jgi:hypothetical protein
LKKSAQLAQLLGSSQRPWTKTTGVVPEALAAWISRLSRSEIDAMTDSPPVGLCWQIYESQDLVIC